MPRSTAPMRNREIPREGKRPVVRRGDRGVEQAPGRANGHAEKSAALGTLNKELGLEVRRWTTCLTGPEIRGGPGATDLHGRWWEQRIARQKEIDASIAAKADYEYLYDKP